MAPFENVLYVSTHEWRPGELVLEDTTGRSGSNPFIGVTKVELKLNSLEQKLQVFLFSFMWNKYNYYMEMIHGR